MTTLFAVIVILSWLWLGLSALPAGLEARMPMPYMIALTPFLWIPLVITAGVAAWQHEWGGMCLLLASAVMTSSQRISYWGTGLTSGTKRETPRETDLADRGTTCETLPNQFAVMTLNCRYGRANAESIVAAVRERHIAVLALQEVSDELVARLDAAGIADLLPYRQSGEPQDTDNGGYNVLFSRYEPAAAVPNVVEIPAADVPAMTLKLTDEAASTDTPQHSRTITFCSAHPKSPMRGCADWSAGILGLGAVAKASAIGDHNIAVVMGDLNSSTDHPSFRALLKSGFKDASLTQAAGPNLTFPRWVKWPRIELDHILFTPGLKPSGVRSFEVKDTDHLALTATLTLR
ncbi:endonuclease/exonuclease/phosphatase family protein [Bifidobacterium saguini DSM 23967]|uniref:Endonuclease/exonuclease/phosphatase family protein n=2 Tax=Bifidobacterium saguini TaxID=762210 RepID=A0A087D8G2_9BIFI|nr:endonuclease/exonuclease/phosphatase family protein [Bifidobacterium saguini]KFI91812.1 endonuclease/exonuclease/phosphatase family protein [Bifidobacterium saguini DSM 23967]QTB90175.1 endonuclease/exonuclease/phosphatase family protein [Bifidobacterium saguini]